MNIHELAAKIEREGSVSVPREFAMIVMQECERHSVSANWNFDINGRECRISRHMRQGEDHPPSILDLLFALDFGGKIAKVYFMNQPYRIPSGKVLVFSDVHQRTNWADAVMAHEAGNVDHTVFLGDAFDSFHLPPEVTGIRETAQWYRDLIYRPNTTVLIGNHDCPYMETFSASRQFKKKIPIYTVCSGYSNNKSIEIAKEMNWPTWRKVQLFAVANGWLLSHAGFRENYWWTHLTDEENLSSLWTKSQEAMEMVGFGFNPLFAVGYGRGGDVSHGGPVWCDWDTEFEDNLPLPQIVGHSSDKCLRKIGNSFCIDYGIGYCIIHPDSTVEHKILYCTGKDENGVLIWKSGKPTVRDDTEHAEGRRFGTNLNMRREG